MYAAYKKSILIYSYHLNFNTNWKNYLIMIYIEKYASPLS